MSEFSFKDEDVAPEKPQAQPPAPPTPAPPTPAPPTPVAPTAPASAAQTPAARLPSPPLPQAPQGQAPQATTPQATTPQAPTPQISLPQVATPQAPQAPQAQTPQGVPPRMTPGQVPASQPTQRIASPSSSVVPPSVVPSPALPTATPATPIQSGPQAQGAPRTAAPQAGGVAVPRSAAGQTPGQAPRPAAPGQPTTGQAATGQTAPASKAAPSPVLPLAGSAARATAEAKARGNMPEAGELARAGMKTTPREHVDDKDIPLWRVWLDKLDPIAFWLIRVGVTAGGLALAYLLYAVFSGNIGKPDAVANMAQATQNITTAATVLRFAMAAIALSLIVLMFDEKMVGLGLAVLGFALQFGSPLLIKNLGVTDATNALAKQLMTLGLWLLVLGLLKYSLDAARWLSDLPGRMSQRADVGVAQFAEPAQQRTARNANMFSPCWQLPFCREVIRKQCPAYLARTACWKFGRGCYCDEEMISRIIRGEAIDQIKAPTRMSRQGKPPCGRCYIFLEHQTLKYKLISPLAIPATIGIMFVGWPVYRQFFGGATKSLGFLWEKLSFASTATTVTETVVRYKAGPTISASSTIDPAYVQQAAQNMFGFLIGFFVLIYLSKAIEWAIFKAKL